MTKDLFVCGATGLRCEGELPAPPLVWPELAPKTTCNAEPRHEAAVTEDSRLEPAPDVWDLSKKTRYDSAGRPVSFAVPGQPLFDADGKPAD